MTNETEIAAERELCASDLAETDFEDGEDEIRFPWLDYISTENFSNLFFTREITRELL